jgi:hypothetical protein
MEASPFTYEQLGYGPNFNIALNMSLDQLKFYCVNNELFRKICSNQDFWLQRLQNEYPTLINDKPFDMTYGQYYIYLKERKFISVAYNNQIVGEIEVHPGDNLKDVYDKALFTISSINPNVSDRDYTILLKFVKSNIPGEEITKIIKNRIPKNKFYADIPAIKNGKLFADIISISSYNQPVKQFTRHV